MGMQVYQTGHVILLVPARGTTTLPEMYWHPVWGTGIPLRVPGPPLHLSSIVDSTSLTNHTYPDLPRILQALLDLMSNVASQPACRKFIDLLGFDDDAHLATCLDSEGFFHAGKRVRNTLQSLQALDIEINRLTTSAGASSRNGIRCLYDNGFQGLRLRLAGMVRNHRMNHLGRLAETTCDLTANDCVGAFNFLVNGLAHVM